MFFSGNSDVFSTSFFSSSMGFELKILLLVSTITTSMVENLPPLLPVLVHAESQVPCYFIFGDSLVDNGNNNNLATIAKANYPPYGIDFLGEPTGRFCNGYNIADIIAQYLGFNESTPPFSTAKGREILKGVNYGSGGAGILDETGRNLILYEMKAKKVILFGPGIIGCTPVEIAIYGTNGSTCVDFINDYVQLFNDRFKPLVNKLNSKLNGANFTFIDVIQLSSRNTSTYGITVTNAPCCNVSSNGMCIPNSFSCSNRSIYAFYDGFHPTKIANVLLGAGAYYAKNTTYAYPYGIQTLVG